jgi:hypothetical protein
MALVVADRVKETSTTAGTGTLTLAGAVAGFQSFAVVGDANTTYYTIVDTIANTWEVGIGTYTVSGTTLSRDTVLSNSSGTTTQISFASNSKDVFVTYPASKSTYEDEGQAVYAGAGTGAIYLASNTITVNTTVPANYNGMTPGVITVANGITVTVADGSRWVVV